MSIIAVDHGNHAIKTPNFHYSSSLTEHLVRPPLSDEIIEYGGKYYTLSGERIPYMRDKTRDERFFILTLFAIAKELKQAGSLQGIANIELAVGLPPEHFGKQRDRFADYFRREGIINFVYKDTPLSISINHVSVFTQAFAAVAPKIGELRQSPQTFIIDIGGYTTDVLLLRYGKPDIRFCRSLETGIITMNNALAGQVNSLHDMVIEDTHILAILKNEKTILPADVQQTIRSAAEQHAGHIVDQLRELQVDLRSNPAIFIGGGSILLRPYIEQTKQVTAAQFVEDIRANAVGYNMLMAAKMSATSF